MIFILNYFYFQFVFNILSFKVYYECNTLVFYYNYILYYITYILNKKYSLILFILKYAFLRIEQTN